MRHSVRTKDFARFSDMLGAMGTEVRLKIMRMLLAAHPRGMTVGEIQVELDMPASTLSHHLEKLRTEDLTVVRRDSRHLWYSANTDALEELLEFLVQECCGGTKAVKPSFLKQLRA